MGVAQSPRPRSVWIQAPGPWRSESSEGSLTRSSASSGLAVRGRGRKAASTSESAFLEGMRPALSIAQVFGLLPVARPSSHRDATFRWRSFRVFWSVLIVVGTLAESVLSFMRMFETGVRFITSVNVVFFTTALVGAAIFLHLGSKWRVLVSAWASVELLVVRDLGTPLHFRSSMLIATCVILGTAAVEHVLSICSTMVYVWPCYQRGGVQLLVQGYFLTKYMKTFTTVGYSFWKGMVVFFIQVVATFIWNFLDLFIMLVSLGIGTQFRELNAAIEGVRGQIKPTTFWKGKREVYTTLSALTKRTDTLIGPVVLLSYASNLYFVCLQCVVVTKKRIRTTSVLHTTYFCFSLMFLILRMTVTAYITALIYDESKKPKDVLFSVPSDGFNAEVQRFLAQVTTDTVSLSGCNFFSVTRSFILTVAGTVVTYLVVLIQFDDNATDPDSAQSNNSVACTCTDLKNYNC